MQTLTSTGVKDVEHSARRLLGLFGSTYLNGLVEIRRSLICLNSVRGAAYQLLVLASL